MKTKHSLVAGTLIVAAFAVVAAAGCQAHTQTQQYVVPSPSMEPTLPLQSTVSVQKHPYASVAQVQRGDVIVCTTPKLGQALLIKRVIGLPGDHVRLYGTSIWINGQPLPHTPVRQTADAQVFQESSQSVSYTVAYQRTPQSSLKRAVTIAVPQNTVFVLGDNRDDAYDSRYLGPLPFASIVGKQVP